MKDPGQIAFEVFTEVEFGTMADWGQLPEALKKAWQKTAAATIKWDDELNPGEDRPAE